MFNNKTKLETLDTMVRRIYNSVTTRVVPVLPLTLLFMISNSVTTRGYTGVTAYLVIHDL